MQLVSPKNLQLLRIGFSSNEVTDPENIINEFSSEFQHKLRIRKVQDHMKSYELLHNTLCDLRPQNCIAIESIDFKTTELKTVLEDLKSAKCADSSGFIVSRSGTALFQSMRDMFIRIKKDKTFPLDWNKILVQDTVYFPCDKSVKSNFTSFIIYLSFLNCD